MRKTQIESQFKMENYYAEIMDDEWISIWLNLNYSVFYFSLFFNNKMSQRLLETDKQPKIKILCHSLFFLNLNVRG